jgi:hypothetical protein
MNSTHTSEIQASHVSALFPASAISFSMKKGATFADLADSLGQFESLPTAIYLTVGVSNRPVSTLHSGI